MHRLALPPAVCEAQMKGDGEAFARLRLRASTVHNPHISVLIGSPLLILQHKFGQTQHGGDGVKKKRERRNPSVWERYKPALDFPFLGAQFFAPLLGKLVFFFSGWKHKLINKQKDGARDCESTWLQLV